MDLPAELWGLVCAALPVTDRIRCAAVGTSLRDGLARANLLPAGPCCERVRVVYEDVAPREDVCREMAQDLAVLGRFLADVRDLMLAEGATYEAVVRTRRNGYTVEAITGTDYASARTSVTAGPGGMLLLYRRECNRMVMDPANSIEDVKVRVRALLEVKKAVSSTPLPRGDRAAIAHCISSLSLGFVRFRFREDGEDTACAEQHVLNAVLRRPITWQQAVARWTAMYVGSVRWTCRDWLDSLAVDASQAGWTQEEKDQFDKEWSEIQVNWERIKEFCESNPEGIMRWHAGTLVITPDYAYLTDDLGRVGARIFIRDCYSSELVLDQYRSRHRMDMDWYGYDWFPPERSCMVPLDFEPCPWLESVS